MPAPVLSTFVSRFGALPAMCLAVFIHITYGSETLPESARFCSGILGAAVIAAVAFGPRNTVPALALSLGLIYASLGLSSFFPVRPMTLAGPLVPSQRALENMALAILLYAGALTITALLFDVLSRPLGQRLAKLGARADAADASNSRLLVGITTALAFIVTKRVHLGSLNQPVGIFASPSIFVPLLMWSVHRDRTLVAKCALASALALPVFVGLLSGMLSDALMPLLVVGILGWKFRGRLPLAPALFVVITLVVLSPVKNIYRRNVWYSTEELSTLDRVNAWIDAFGQYYSPDRTDALEDAGTVTAERLSTLGQVAQIFEWVPNRIPHDGPDRWLMAPLLLVPRVVWPSKPIQEEVFNKHYTHLFRIQDPRRSAGTSITLPAVGDGYWRLGMTGVVIEGVIAGMLCGVAQGVGRASGLGPLLIAASVAQQHPDTHAFGSFNGMLQLLFMDFVVLWLVGALAPFVKGKRVVLPTIRRNAS